MLVFDLQTSQQRGVTVLQLKHVGLLLNARQVVLLVIYCEVVVLQRRDQTAPAMLECARLAGWTLVRS